MSVSLLEEVMSRRESLLLPQLSLLTPSLTKFRSERQLQQERLAGRQSPAEGNPPKSAGSPTHWLGNLPCLTLRPLTKFRSEETSARTLRYSLLILWGTPTGD